MKDDLGFYEEFESGLGNNGAQISAPIIISESKDSVEEEPQTYSLGGFGDLSIEGEDEEVEGEVGYNIEDEMREQSDIVISSIVGDKVIKGYAQDVLFQSYNPTLFSNENFVVYSVIYKNRQRISKLIIDEEFIKLWLLRNRKFLEENKDKVDLSAYGEVDGSSTIGYIGGVVKHFIRLRSMNSVTVEEFETALEKYKLNYEKNETRKLLQRGQSILEDGLTIKRKTLVGFSDCSKYIKEGLLDIENVLNPVNAGSTHISLYDMVMNPSLTKSRIVSDFGGVREFNEAYGGIRTGVFYSWLAPPKSGKSKFGAMIVHNALMRGTNVTVWNIEGGAVAFMAQIRAIHFDYFYNKGDDCRDAKFGVNQSTILNDSFETEELRSLENSSAVDLVVNGGYGKLSFINRDVINIEDFLQLLEENVENNNSELVLIDYLQMVTSSNGLSQFDTVGKAYRELLSFCHSKNIAVCSPAQMKQETVDKLMEAKDPTTVELRTAGGGSSESIRTPDILFALCATTQDIIEHKLTLIPLPSRLEAPVKKKIEVNVDFGVCRFKSSSYVEM